jgi:large subunit ribosomal protein L9
MPIEIILKEHVEHLGQRGQVVKVASGYARNYLFPRKLALAVTDENKRQVERDRVKAESREKVEISEAQTLAATIEGAEVAIGRRVGENQTLYGSVTSADIADALAARDITIDRRKIQLVDPIRSLGDHVVPVKLHREVTANIKLKIVPAE